VLVADYFYRGFSRAVLLALPLMTWRWTRSAAAAARAGKRAAAAQAEAEAAAAARRAGGTGGRRRVAPQGHAGWLRGVTGGGTAVAAAAWRRGARRAVRDCSGDTARARARVELT
jgi:hypothetical protein